MGLLKTGLKVAVAVKTADVIHERILARQHEHWAAQGHSGAAMGPAPAGSMPQTAAAAPAAAYADTPAPLPPAPPAPADMGHTLQQLKQLGELRTAGVLTDAEFEAQKARILSA
jgi:Short C-terminal domain